MGKIERSWELVKASWSVLRTDKELLVFPLVSAAAVCVVLATFAVPMFLAGIFDGTIASAAPLPFLGIVLGFAFYVVQYMVIFYCNSALMGAALIRLDGGQPTIGDGFRIANQHLGAIFGYALLSATVGIILRQIAQRGIIGRIVATMFGLGWNIATFLAVPVLIMEGVGPIDAVKRSTQLLKKTWGEQIVGNIGIGAAFGAITFVIGLLFAGALVAAISSQVPALIVGVAVVFIAAIMMLSLVGSTLSAIYKAAVYRYATKGDGGGVFDAELVSGAFTAK
jgi:Family of unknown function (DUF6159)